MALLVESQPGNADLPPPSAKVVSNSTAVPPGFPWVTRARHALAARVMVPIDLLTPRFHQQGFGILAYHRISPNVPAGPNLCVSPSRFESQIAGLLRLGFEPCPLRSLLETHRAGGQIPRKAFVICFDDGYAGVHRYALPILNRLDAPATVFLPTGHLNTQGPRAFDPWGLAHPHVAEDALRIMSYEECHELQDSGLFELACHTHMHENMQGRTEVFAEDMRLSVELLRNEFGVSRPLFSYPFGMTNQAMRDVVRNSGVICALTTDCQLVKPGDDPFNWGRLGAEQYDTPRSLAAKLSGTYSMVQNTYRRLKRTLGFGAPAHLREDRERE